MKIHNLKTHTGPFKAIAAGLKMAEIRLNDRNYQVGDTLWLLEYFPEEKIYSGKKICAKVIHILDEAVYGLQPNFIMMSLEFLKCDFTDACGILCCHSCGADDF